MNYNELYQEVKNAINYDRVEVDFYLINKLAETLKEKAINESAKEAGDGSRLKYAKVVLKTQKKSQRQILTKAIIRDSFQVFTDSFIGFRLSNHITGLDTHEIEKNGLYPDLERIIKMSKDNARNEITLNVLDIKQSLSTIKNDGHIDIQIDDISKVRFQKKYLEVFLNVLGYNKNDDNITLYYKNEISAFYSKEKNGSGDGIILPIRVE